jgi:D-galactose 1-dehydrogenase
LIKVALVGIGKIAIDQHAPAITNSSEWELSATVSRRGKLPGIPAFSDFDTMLASCPDIRVVSLCLPPVPRFAYAAKALRLGRHVMLEKPPGATLSECHALRAIARTNRLALYATWHAREANKIAVAKAWLKNKRLHKIKVIWKEDVRRWHPDQQWVWEPGGLGVFDPGINALSIVTEILPDSIYITEASLEFPANRQTPIAASLRFAHPHGADATMILDWRQQGTQVWTIEAKTDQGKLLLLDGGAQIQIDGQDTILTDDHPLSGEYANLYTKMAQLVADGGIDMDLEPMRHVADAFTLGHRMTVDPFEW